MSQPKPWQAALDREGLALATGDGLRLDRPGQQRDALGFALTPNAAVDSLFQGLSEASASTPASMDRASAEWDQWRIQWFEDGRLSIANALGGALSLHLLAGSAEDWDVDADATSVARGRVEPGLAVVVLGDEGHGCLIEALPVKDASSDASPEHLSVRSFGPRPQFRAEEVGADWPAWCLADLSPPVRAEVDASAAEASALGWARAVGLLLRACRPQSLAALREERDRLISGRPEPVRPTLAAWVQRLGRGWRRATCHAAEGRVQDLYELLRTLDASIDDPPRLVWTTQTPRDSGADLLRRFLKGRDELASVAEAVRLGDDPDSVGLGLNLGLGELDEEAVGLLASLSARLVVHDPVLATIAEEWPEAWWALPAQGTAVE